MKVLIAPDAHRLGGPQSGLVETRCSLAHTIATRRKCLYAVNATPPCAAAPLPQTQPQGQFDGAFGPRVSQAIRRLHGSNYTHLNAPDEWPHTRSTQPNDKAEFWSWAPAQNVAAGPSKAKYRGSSR